MGGSITAEELYELNRGTGKKLSNPYSNIHNAYEWHSIHLASHKTMHNLHITLKYKNLNIISVVRDKINYYRIQTGKSYIMIQIVHYEPINHSID